MKKILLLLLFLFVQSSFIFSQKTPVIKVGEKQLGLAKLDIDVKIVGNIATTTYDMLFYNPTNAVLEGELSFPLGEGHNVSRFALDVNGKLREAVVVEKELGRIAFEAVVRRRVDPALLEKGTGNNYKARIYPIPAKGYKRVVLAYEQELVLTNNAHAYSLPLNFKNKLEKFKLSIEVFDQKYKPVIENNGISGLDFKNWNKNFVTKVEKQNYIADKALLIQIPISLRDEKILANKDYFYIYKALDTENRLRNKPKNITIYWDASLSQEKEKLEKEFNLLARYFDYVSNVNVDFVVFSNVIRSQQSFTIRNGNWNSLKEKINTIVYDGGTDYSIIKPKNTDAVLLFSDGISTLSEAKIYSKTPVFIINNTTKSNHVVLKDIAESTNGSYINLATNTIKEALSKLKYESYKYLGYRSSNKNLEVYPKVPISVSKDFSLTGKNTVNNDTITLLFGYGTAVKQEIEIVLTNQSDNEKVSRIWAQNKLAELEKNSAINKKEIVELGKAFSLVSSHTSLIVLEDVLDYVRYKITPPDELLDEYNRIITTQEEKKNVVQRSTPNMNRVRRANAAENFSARMLKRPPPPVAERIMVVEDDVEVEETVLQSVQSDAVEEEVVEIEDVEYFEEEELTEDVPFIIIEEEPEFPGCTGTKEEKKKCFSESLQNFFDLNFNKDILESSVILSNRIRLFIQFTISRNGTITNVRARTIDRKLETEAIRVIKSLPKLKPGKQRGRAVSVKYVLPVIFSNENNNTKPEITVRPPIQTQQKINYRKYKGSLEIKDRRVITSYLLKLRTTKSIDEAYQLYLKQRENYLKTPAYFVDVYNFFKYEKGSSELANRILSNIPETDFDNYELLKVYAYQLQIEKLYNKAIFIFKQILKLRGEDSQSYRDLALAYQDAGFCQKALDVYLNILSESFYEGTHRRRFNGIENIAKREVKYLIKKYKTDLDLSKVNKELLEEDFNTTGVRVILDWNHNDTDIDLHVIDPNLEECYYQHKSTIIGGKISQDMTQGFGPEEFILPDAIKGDYFVKIKYYGDRYQKMENPTFMKVTLIKNYGKENESKELKIIRLTKNDDEEMIAKISI